MMLASRGLMRARLENDAYWQRGTPFSDALGRAHQVEILEKDQLLRRKDRAWWALWFWLIAGSLVEPETGVWFWAVLVVSLLGIGALAYRERNDRIITQRRMDRVLATHWKLEHS